MSRSRASSLTQRFAGIAEDEPLEPPARPAISSRLPSGQNSPRRELPGFDFSSRPTMQRAASGFEGPTSLSRNESPVGMPRLSRVPTEPTAILAATRGVGSLRIGKRDSQIGDVFGDEQSDYSTEPSSAYERLEHSRTASFSSQDPSKKMPPPPPPSRSKKPPPPPPLKRSALSTSEVPQY
jgi:hypothetical protein